MRDGFGYTHPAITFGFFASAIILSVIVQNPFWIGLSVIASALFLICLRGRDAWRVLGALALAFAVLSLVNPLFNASGPTVLFTYLGGRPYTLEALFYGMQTAGMFASVMAWFACYGIVMTTDRFTYLFGGHAPALTLVFTMILRLIPAYARKASQIAHARACIGMSVRAGDVRARARSGLDVLDALTSWALEGAIITADSMRSRGYGSGPRTQMASYRFSGRDAAMLCLGIALLVGAGAGVAWGCASAQYVPEVSLPEPDAAGIATFSAYAAFLLAPSVICLKERISWRCSISRI